MIDHIEIGTRALEANAAFYADILTPLGYAMTDKGTTKAFADGRGRDFFLVEAAENANVHFAFAAVSRAAVDAAYAKAEARGHKLEQPPHLLPHVHANYYAASLLDPDGRLVEIVCQVAE